MTTSSVSLDVFETFGDTIETFRTRQNSVIESIWSFQIEDEGLETSDGMSLQPLLCRLR